MSTSGEFNLNMELVAGDKAAIDPVKAAILAAVDRCGSISGAGRDLGLSYRKTWMEVDQLNRSWSEPAIDTKPDGSFKGARLTPFGQRLLTIYSSLQQRLCEAAAGEELTWLLSRVRAQPLKSSTAPR